jgi:DNA-binding transcriptional regulator YdaS (Cro superfamily)
MKLREYMSLDGVQPTKLAKELGVAPAYLYQMATGVRTVSAERAIEIERHTSGAVTCEELRPDLADRFGYLRGTLPVTQPAPSGNQAAAAGKGV